MSTEHNTEASPPQSGPAVSSSESSDLHSPVSQSASTDAPSALGSSSFTEDDQPSWLTEYCTQMEAAADAFPITEDEMAALHVKYYDVAYEKMLLESSGNSSELSPQRPVGDRIRSKKARAALTSVKAKYVKRNETAAVGSYLRLLHGDSGEPLTEADAAVFIKLILEKSNSEVEGPHHIRYAALAMAELVAGLSTGGGADSTKLAAQKKEADAALEAQIGANRLLGSRVEELERENSELHRILDDNTNKALDSWSSGQLKIAKMEEELKALREDKKTSDATAERVQKDLHESEARLEKLRIKMEKFVAEEENEGKQVL